jgi:ParB family chromosome partitioning protein
MKNRPGEKIKLASIDELLGVVNEESAMEIEINKIHAFKNHPFKVLDDEKMQDLIESVKLTGRFNTNQYEYRICRFIE